MRFKNTFKTAIAGLETNKSRSALTILGIVIGITAIILITSLGQGAQNLVLEQVESMGSKTIAIVPGRQPKGPTDIISTFTDSLKDKDLEALKKKNNVPHLSKIMPVLFGSDTAAYGNETYRPTIFGVTDLFAEIYDMYPSEGRLFSDEETKVYADVVVIGSKVKDELFGGEEAIGKKLKIKGRNFKVIGIRGDFRAVSFRGDYAHRGWRCCWNSTWRRFFFSRFNYFNKCFKSGLVFCFSDFGRHYRVLRCRSRWFGFRHISGAQSIIKKSYRGVEV